MQHGDNTENDCEEREERLSLQCEIIEETLKEFDYTPVQFVNDLIPTLSEVFNLIGQHAGIETQNKIAKSLSDNSMHMILISGDIKVKICEEENHFPLLGSLSFDDEE